ncbi:response regulator [uncultured Thiodictyon sp.]|uniref:response regulator transcription factor n=1 Tax=uncultured Thiodictyon sp. TaxID=1846217 RepID=UPI0025FE40A9|nr:response regulator [uncultured Thiodictyon sp.]
MTCRLSVIVIEDHDDLRAVTVAALRELGHSARGLPDGEALDAELRAARTDLLVLDLNLPGEDGISLARRARGVQPDIGIIIVTVREQLSDKIAGYDSGADIYLTKPTSIEELGAAIAALARRLRPPGTGTEPPELDFASDVTSSRDKVRALRDYLIGVTGKVPTLAGLAGQFGLSLRRCNDVFTQEYGSSIAAYVSGYRLERAREAVLTTNVPLKVIAERLGYTHVNHFNAAFSRRFGYPPGALRKNRKESL